MAKYFQNIDGNTWTGYIDTVISWIKDVRWNIVSESVQAEVIDEGESEK